MDAFEHIQREVLEFFEKIPTDVFIECVESFVYHQPTSNPEVSTLLTQFLKENGLSNDYILYLQDINEKEKKYFCSCSHSSRKVIEDIKFALFNLSFNKFRIDYKEKKLLESDKEVLKSEKKVLECTNKILKLEKKMLGEVALDAYESLNRSECYIHGEEEDKKIVDKVKKLSK